MLGFSHHQRRVQRAAGPEGRVQLALCWQGTEGRRVTDLTSPPSPLPPPPKVKSLGGERAAAQLIVSHLALIWGAAVI